VSPLYVAQSGVAAERTPAQQRIIEAAVWSAVKGPWRVTDSSIEPPSGDASDYLSWAPYWWPDCNWCSGGAGAQSDGSEGDDPDDAPSSAAGPIPTALPVLPQPGPQRPYNALSSILDSLSRAQAVATGAPDAERPSSIATPEPYYWLSQALPKLPAYPAPLQSALSYAYSKVPAPVQTAIWGVASAKQELPIPNVWGQLPQVGYVGQATATALPTPYGQALFGRAADDSRATASPTTTAAATGAPLAPRAGKCTPSRTSVAPSATWTKCPYKQRDGKLNPDVRQLNNTRDVVSMAQSVLWNGVAYGLTNDTAHAKRAVRLIQTWFLDPRTGVKPRLTYGQVVRGPGSQEGGYTGILDWRMLIKVVNAVVVLRSNDAEAWNSVLATAMAKWASDYVDWLTTSAEGRRAAKVANNHATFYYNQLVSLYVLLGDVPRARTAVNAFFTTVFMKQISEDGEQPYEAVRTRPFHYRCFNIEGLLANAKLADNLGLNMWSARSDDGATIQTAVDYAMTLDAGDEDVTELAPHVAAVAAAYGDPTGKYARWLADENNSGDPDAIQSWRFYDSADALYSSPSAGNTASSQKFA
jgi:hypothetical protein